MPVGSKLACRPIWLRHDYPFSGSLRNLTFKSGPGGSLRWGSREGDRQIFVPGWLPLELVGHFRGMLENVEKERLSRCATAGLHEGTLRYIACYRKWYNDDPI